ncbi:hypothetical protein J4407_00755 [Candidatus Pacearchaeota archaeon]|nr:hypothetical protein [Candidatus Pacearchaeota archaeon]
MESSFTLLIGGVVLLLGIPTGDFLAKITKEELGENQKYLRIITLVSFVGALVSLILGEDIFLFSFLFISIVTSRSLAGKKSKK